MVVAEDKPIYAPFFGVMGAASAIIFSGKNFLRAPYVQLTGCAPHKILDKFVLN